MLFNFLEFIFVFLPIAAALHFLPPAGELFPVIVTTITSLFFYAWWKPPFVMFAGTFDCFQLLGCTRNLEGRSSDSSSPRLGCHRKLVGPRVLQIFRLFFFPCSSNERLAIRTSRLRCLLQLSSRSHF